MTSRTPTEPDGVLNGTEADQPWVLPKDPDPSFMGYSVGRWDGDTLVVDTTGFKDQTWLDFSGLPVYVDPTSSMYLHGASVDYVETIMGAGFKVDNPNAVSSCGCGSSFNTDAAAAAATHGGCGCG